MLRRNILLAIVLGASGASGCASLPPGEITVPMLDTLRTRAERTDFRETSRFDEVVAFMEAADGASPQIHLTTFAVTNEGRRLPLAVVGNVADASPGAVRASGKTVVYLQGNIHAGEVEGKEALQMLLREIAANAARGAARLARAAHRAHLQRRRQRAHRPAEPAAAARARGRDGHAAQRAGA